MDRLISGALYRTKCTRPVEETGLVIRSKGALFPPDTHWKLLVGMWNEGYAHPRFFFPPFVQHLSFNRPVEGAIGSFFPSHIPHLPSSLFHYSYTYMFIRPGRFPLSSIKTYGRMPFTTPRYVTPIPSFTLLRFFQLFFFPLPDFSFSHTIHLSFTPDIKTNPVVET